MFILPVDQEIYLQIIEPVHRDELYALVDRNRLHLRKWLPWVDEVTSVGSYEPIIREWLKQLALNQGFQAGIRYNHQLAGLIGFHSIDWSNRKTALGYWLGEGYQGHGIMTKACHAVVQYAFQNYQLNRVEIQAGVYNRKSRAIPERLGFTNEGCIRDGEFLYDHYIDLVVYGMLKRDWVNRLNL